MFFQEWGLSAPEQEYQGAFRLEHDMSWTPSERMDQRAHELAQLNGLLAADAHGASLNKALMMDTSAP